VKDSKAGENRLDGHRGEGRIISAHPTQGRQGRKETGSEVRELHTGVVKPRERKRTWGKGETE